MLTTLVHELATTRTYARFLVPAPDGAADDVIRVTGLNSAEPALDHLIGAVLLSPPGDRRGLGLRIPPSLAFPALPPVP